MQNTSVINRDAVDHIVIILNLDKYEGDLNAILKNLVYYTPRIRSKAQLAKLVKSLLESRIWLSGNSNEVLPLYELTEAIFHWKLEISEPVVRVCDFYEIWDNAFKQCRSWSIVQLAFLSGVLSTQSKFEDLQSGLFIDDSGLIHDKYREWRRNFFLPLFHEIMKTTLTPNLIDQMALIYAPLCLEDDGRHIPSVLVVRSLFNLTTQYMLHKCDEDTFLSRHLSSIAKALQTLLADASQSTAYHILRVTCDISFELSIRELNAPKQNYSSKYYSNVLLTIVLILRGCASQMDIPSEWTHLMFITLFYVNFIVHDFGSVGFSSYEYIYELSATSVSANFVDFSSTLAIMQGNIWSQVNNNVNDSKVLFMLSFLEKPLASSPVLPGFLRDTITPLIFQYINSSNSEILESAHMAYLSLFANMVSDRYLDYWKVKHAETYISQSTNQFMEGKLSSRQLLLIYQMVSSQLPHLKELNRELTRELLHSTYLRIINCKNNEKKSTLIECLICQVTFVDKSYTCDWLENCLELINTCPDTRDKLLDKLWKTILSDSQNEVALAWWYSEALPSKCNL